MTTETTNSTVVIERTLRAPVERVWKMWTTKEGLEKWWGPEGFTSVVRRLDVRAGGAFEIEMTAVLPAIVAHLTAAGIPVTSAARGDYTDVTSHARLAYTNAVDFVPGVAPYQTTTTVEMAELASGGTSLRVATDAMHDAHWTKMATMGWEGQLTKLAALFAEAA